MNKENPIQSFTDLKVWQEGHKLVIMVYTITKTFPKSEMYSLVDQMRRSAISITSNVAEGFGRQSFKEKLQFYFLAQGSLLELKNIILVARDVGYLKPKEFDVLAVQANTTDKLLRNSCKKLRLLSMINKIHYSLFIIHYSGELAVQANTTDKLLRGFLQKTKTFINDK